MYLHILQDEKLQKEVYRELTNKVVHSRMNVYIKCYTNMNFSRSKKRDNVDNSTRRDNLRETVGFKPKKTQKISK